MVQRGDQLAGNALGFGSNGSRHICGAQEELHQVGCGVKDHLDGWIHGHFAQGVAGHEHGQLQTHIHGGFQHAGAAKRRGA